ncbi:acyl-CoA dehydrogenase [Hydrogenophaga borbori]|uniref:Acyl-CoA dehydrogenase n=1 Tax=Hydrogenophaga borbori TaxID=2294117 RepID=A0A372EGE6_9BURK|nr:acyl-CoA dehydrogenase family protein [Hydrogenophaga borbori]RFP77374.1 acyl-CoA dehydrogenase [Hydrogenophaga borbori]
MNFELNDDQRALLDAVEQVVQHHLARTPAPARVECVPELDRDLEQGGYFEAVTTEGLGPVAAAAMVIALARLPFCTELGASALLAPRLGLPRVCAVLGEDRHTPARFLAQAACAVAIEADGVFAAALAPGDAREVESLWAYPMGELVAPEALPWRRLDADPKACLDLWRVALAAEIAGCLSAALTSVVQHVSDRRQFGRPLGSLQAVQHRLAHSAVAVEGVRWLALAAAAGSVPAALALGQAQQAVRPVAYDLHQFMGAMGLTLEHPLHRWTYRARRLQSELGAADRQFQLAAGQAWPA